MTVFPTGARKLTAVTGGGTCPSCGSEVAGEARFCPSCGHRSASSPTSAASSPCCSPISSASPGWPRPAIPRRSRTSSTPCFAAPGRRHRRVRRPGRQDPRRRRRGPVRRPGRPRGRRRPGRAGRPADAADAGRLVGRRPAWPTSRCASASTPARCWSASLRADGDYTAMGDVVNIASRLQGIAAPGQVVVGPGTYQATRAHGPLLAARRGRGQGPRRAGRRRGWPSGPSCPRAPGRAGAAARSSAASASSALLGQAVDTAVNRDRAHLLLVIAEAGMGKTRLAEEVAAAGRASPRRGRVRRPLRPLRRGQRVVAGRRGRAQRVRHRPERARSGRPATRSPARWLSSWANRRRSTRSPGSPTASSTCSATRARSPASTPPGPGRRSTGRCSRSSTAGPTGEAGRGRAVRPALGRRRRARDDRHDPRTGGRPAGRVHRHRPLDAVRPVAAPARPAQLDRPQPRPARPGRGRASCSTRSAGATTRPGSATSCSTGRAATPSSSRSWWRWSASRPSDAELGAERTVVTGPTLTQLPDNLRGLVAARLDGLSVDERRVLADAAVLGRRGDARRAADHGRGVRRTRDRRAASTDWWPRSCWSSIVAGGRSGPTWCARSSTRC